jgi:hypothetical protein
MLDRAVPTAPPEGDMTAADHRIAADHRTTRRATAREQATVRTRRYRERRRNGLAIAPVPYDNAIVGMLLDLGWLALGDSENHRAIGAAISAMLNDAAKNR